MATLRSGILALLKRQPRDAAVRLDVGVVQPGNFDDYEPTRMHGMPRVEVHIVASPASGWLQAETARRAAPMRARVEAEA
jgi:hypothetical protein